MTLSANTVALPALILIALASFAHDLLRDLRARLREDEFDRETTLADWLGQAQRPQLTLLAPPNAAGGGTSPTREATHPNRETETSAP